MAYLFEPFCQRTIDRFGKQSQQHFKAEGMTESALGVDSENPSGANRLYEECGFHAVKRTIVLSKPL
jgi:mycothiol synthase